MTDLHHSPNDRRPETEKRMTHLHEAIATRAAEIDPERFVSSWSYGSILNPYGLLPALPEDNIGRVWWVWDPQDQDPWVTAEDFMHAHPEVTWEAIYQHEEKSEFLEPGEHSTWEKFRGHSIGHLERLIWLVIGALITTLVTKL
jgi:hypothetical protein